MNDLFSRRKPPTPPATPPVDLGDEDPRYLFELAQVATRRGRWGEARDLCRRILTAAPDHLAAKQLLAFAMAQEGDFVSAIPLLRDVLEVQPSNIDALMGLSQLLRNTGELEESLQISLRAAELQPEAVPVLHNLARGYLTVRRLPEALDVLGRVLLGSPRFAPGLLDRGIVLHELGRAVEAAEDLRAALAINPDLAPAHIRLGNIYLANGNADAAIVHFRRAFELDPQAPQARVQLARALIEEGNFAEAERTLREAIAIFPGFAEAHALLGRMLQQVGRFDEAYEALDQALAIQPERTATFYTYINGRKTTDADRPLLERMTALGESGRLSLEEQRPLYYALGKAFEDLGEYETSFRHFERANELAQARLRGAGRVFDPARFKEKTDQIIAAFPRALFDARQSEGRPSDLPIFIVGMARSGTTLLEQIVSSHPEVGAAGELGYWLIRTGRVPANELAEVESSTLIQWGQDYLDLLERRAPGKRHVTDKMPQNFMALGPIHLSLPHAKIIHCRRSPIDTCLSIFTTSFNAGPDFAHDRDDLVFAYREYLRLVAHWRAVLPAESFLEVDYEELVANREVVTRRMIDFLGLSWSDACLHHESNAHAISTPSLWQARQPVYRSSVARWRRFEPWLGGLRELLNMEAS